MTLGLLFPGQGSQSVGMGQDFAAHHALARQIFEEANEVLGFDLQRLCAEGPEEALTLTYNAQAAILTVSTIAHRLLANRVAVTPGCVAGHSLGEYSAIVSVGGLSFAKGVKAVYQRGQFMQEATPVGVGAMAAMLGITADELERICQEEAQGQVVGPANYNTPGQIAISGHAEAVLRVLARGKGKQLPVSAPFHSALMAPAAEAMRTVLAGLGFEDTSAPVMTNVDNLPVTAAVDFPDSLVRQITSPVRWDSGVMAMQDLGVDRMVELGNGRILVGMMKRIARDLPVLNVMDDASLAATAEALAA